jgi:site-specific DNA-methyltransferase (adenine-specific)
MTPRGFRKRPPLGTSGAAAIERTIKVVQDDCLHFLSSLPDNSIDLIVTDPAYSGMNGHLKLGKGRIVGKYSDKEKETGSGLKNFKTLKKITRIFSTNVNGF